MKRSLLAWRPPPGRVAADVIWASYYLLTEDYDRRLPHVMRGGSALPLPAYFGESRAYAARLTRTVERQLARYHCSPAESQEAKAWAEEQSEKVLVAVILEAVPSAWRTLSDPIKK